MRTISFQHVDRSRTSAYRLDFIRVGEEVIAHTVQTDSVVQTVADPPTYAATLDASQKPAEGTYMISVTAINALSEASSELAGPFATQPPLTAPTGISVGY